MRKAEWDNGGEIFLRNFQKPEIQREMAVLTGLKDGLGHPYS